MDTYAFARHALDADPGISGDIIFLVSVLLTFAFGALFIYWFRQENLAKQLEHLSAEGVSVQAFRFDRLEETLRQMSQHSLTQVNDPTNPQGARAPVPQAVTIGAIGMQETRPVIPVQSYSDYSEITGVHTETRAPVPQAVTIGAIGMQETRPVIPSPDPEIEDLKNKLRQSNGIAGNMVECIRAFQAITEAGDLVAKQRNLEIASRLHDIRDIDRFVKNAYKEIDKLKLKINVDRSENKRMSDDIGLRSVRTTDLRSELKEKKQTIVSLKNQVESLNDKHAQRTESYEQDRRKQKETIADLTSEVEQKTLRIGSLEDEVKKHKKQLDRTNGFLSGIEKEIKALKLQREDMMSRTEQLTTTNNKLSAEIDMNKSAMIRGEARIGLPLETLVSWEQEQRAVSEEMERNEEDLIERRSKYNNKKKAMTNNKTGSSNREPVRNMKDTEAIMSIREKEFKENVKESYQFWGQKASEHDPDGTPKATETTTPAITNAFIFTNVPRVRDWNDTSNEDVRRASGTEPSESEANTTTSETDRLEVRLVSPAINNPVVSAEMPEERNREDESQSSDSGMIGSEADSKSSEPSTVEPPPATSAIKNPVIPTESPKEKNGEDESRISDLRTVEAEASPESSEAGTFETPPERTEDDEVSDSETKRAATYFVPGQYCELIGDPKLPSIPQQLQLARNLRLPKRNLRSSISSKSSASLNNNNHLTPRNTGISSPFSNTQV
ncbi:hypothetical protein A1F97_10908 [Pyrenophora tritici-repentis]|nr:hypothetical protein A1F97_10908 [Pyrenophora tritici-repentis]